MLHPPELVERFAQMRCVVHLGGFEAMEKPSMSDRYPRVMKHCGKSPFLMGKVTINGDFP